VQFSIDNHTEYLPNIELLEQITKNYTDKDIELIICENEYICQLNHEFRDKNKATDVLSFPYDDMPMTPLGSIVISVDFVKAKSKEFHHTVDEEFTLLFIHGLLHLLGYDHEIDNGEQREEEQKIIQKFNLPHSLIIRNQ